jgi:cob(I)alamin adenosyltransferase
MSPPRFYTGRGDDGQTGLLGPERVPKCDPRPEAYGTVDEAQAALGLARASKCTPDTAEILLAIQRDLHTLMAELASAGSEDSPFAGTITAAHVEQLESWIEVYGNKTERPKKFVIPGDSTPGAGLHLARTVVRRAERMAVRLADTGGMLVNGQVLRYLNRLSSLLYVLALYEDQLATGRTATLASAGK